MSISIGVVVPFWRYWANPIKLQPLWELYYATQIQNWIPDAEVRIVDLRDRKTPADASCDIYFYWVMKSADSQDVYGVVRDLRERAPKSVHMAGGNHVDHLTDECAAVFDAVFLGTAENAIPKAIADARSGRLEKIYRTDVACPFSSYPHPRRHFLPTDRVVNAEHFQQYGGVLGTGAYFSRGCAFHCRFCVYNNPGNFEYRTPEQITAEIEYLKAEYGIGGVNLRDEVCIPINPRVCRDYIEAIGKTGVIWRGQTVPFGHEDMVRLAAEAGCKELALGVENVESEEVLRISNKPNQSIDKARGYIETLKKHGIKVKVCLIMGLPGETNQVLERTIRFLEEVRPDFVAVSGFDPVPGSPFYAEPERYGIKWIDKDFSRHAHLVYRFGHEEDTGLPFEYADETPFGPGRKRADIVNDIRTLQDWLRERGMSY